MAVVVVLMRLSVKMKEALHLCYVIPLLGGLPAETSGIT